MAINLYTLAIGVCLAASEPTTLMTVGTMDGKVSEFALAPDGWAKWGATFGANVEFHVGTDDASRAFPFIHPGPMDVWAGNASHAFSIEFPLDQVPAGQCLLQIGLCRSHYAYPPRFTVRVNEGEPKTFATARDGTIQKMSHIVPAGVLRKGPNRITIENADGSWFQYDGLVLMAYGDGRIPETIDSLTVEDTVFFKQEDGELRQVLRVNVGGLWDGAGTLRVQAGDASSSVDARTAAYQDGVLDVCIPPVAQETEVTVELTTSQGAKAAAKCVARPHRQWQIFVAMKTHYDLGYTEPIDEMLERSSGPMLDLVLQYCDRGRDFSSDHRFIWTYPTWMVDELQEFQGGDFRFSYALRAHGAGVGPDARFGWESAAPLRAIIMQQGKGTLPPNASLLSVTPENVVLVNLKRAEDGDGWIVRLYETAGRRVAARLTWGLWTPQSAVMTRLTEHPLPEGGTTLKVLDKAIESTIGPFEIQTLRVK